MAPFQRNAERRDLRFSLHSVGKENREAEKIKYNNKPIITQ